MSAVIGSSDLDGLTLVSENSATLHASRQHDRRGAQPQVCDGQRQLAYQCRSEPTAPSLMRSLAAHPDVACGSVRVRAINTGRPCSVQITTVATFSRAIAAGKPTRSPSAMGGSADGAQLTAQLMQGWCLQGHWSSHWWDRRDILSQINPGS